MSEQIIAQIDDSLFYVSRAELMDRLRAAEARLAEALQLGEASAQRETLLRFHLWRFWAGITMHTAVRGTPPLPGPLVRYALEAGTLLREQTAPGEEETTAP